MSFVETVVPSTQIATEKNIQFCEEFRRPDGAPKFILGRNIYAESVAKHVRVQGIVDDFTNDPSFLGLPVVRLRDLPKDALVLNGAGGRPLSARRQLEAAGVRNLDYFSFYRLSGLPLVPIRFNEGFEDEFKVNKSQYEWMHSRLADQLSKKTFEKLVNFRFTYDMSFLEGFTQREDVQYFEDFLGLRAEGETFLDVGSYDGYTSLEFVKRCPQYRSIHVFEPDPANYPACRKALQGLPNVHFHPYGLSNRSLTMRFEMQGSSSKVSESGGVTINVERLDDLRVETPTFIKIDIEGGESDAIDGASITIGSHHPRIAVAAYHAAGDFWRIPRQILAIREDYDIYMRHYTECIYETVLFFIPRR